MFESLIEFSVSALAILMAGYFLTKSADLIAEMTGWGRMFVGGLLLAGATSLPELMVDLKAVEMNLPNLAVGDLLGSSLFNLLILALLDFSFPSAFRRTAFSPQFLHHSLAAVLSIVLTSLIGLAIAARLEFEIGGVGILNWVVIGFYLFGLRLIFVERGSPAEGSEPEAKGLVKAIRQSSFQRAIATYFASAGVIFIAAPYLVRSAEQISTLSGLGQTFIGTTAVALATSLPELVATLTAFRMKAPDLALGNIFGSNAFNMILFFPLDAAFQGSLFAAVRPVHLATVFSVITATGIAVLGQLFRKKQGSRFTEPSSEIVVLVILSFLALLFFLR